MTPWYNQLWHLKPSVHLVCQKWQKRVHVQLTWPPKGQLFKIIPVQNGEFGQDTPFKLKIHFSLTQLHFSVSLFLRKPPWCKATLTQMITPSEHRFSTNQNSDVHDYDSIIRALQDCWFLIELNVDFLVSLRSSSTHPRQRVFLICFWEGRRRDREIENHQLM
jgi:hypothetical protein